MGLREKWNKYMKIRKANSKDILALFSLWQVAGLSVLPYEEEKRVTEQTIQRNPFACFVMVEKNQIIGSILGGFNGRVGSINRLAIDPLYQGKGYGTLLLKKVEEILKKKGARKTVLEVEPAHADLITYYAKHGYEDVRDKYILLKKTL